MPYYVEERWTLKCRHNPCDKMATHELKTSGTASYGYYCKRHANLEAMRRNAQSDDRE